ncbi:MAG: hypothetical protein QOG62_2273 [Thermoleophilaceae bacterium]|jgi:Ca2+-binding RTX toxin-like protein|nr:hypothetical protein [Thermoleophilaceae bacterium]
MPAVTPTISPIARAAGVVVLLAVFAAVAVLAPVGKAGGIKYPTCGEFTVKDLGKNPGEVFQGEVNDAQEFIRGSGKNDLISGGGGPDVIDGGGGDDIICGGKDDDIMTGSKGNDIIIGGADNDEMKGDVGKDTLQGKSGDDKCAGGEKITSCEDVPNVDIPDFPF